MLILLSDRHYETGPVKLCHILSRLAIGSIVTVGYHVLSRKGVTHPHTASHPPLRIFARAFFSAKYQYRVFATTKLVWCKIAIIFRYGRLSPYAIALNSRLFLLYSCRFQTGGGGNKEPFIWRLSVYGDLLNGGTCGNMLHISSTKYHYT